MIFTRLAVLLVGVVALVHGDAVDGEKVTRRAIRPNPSNGHWIDAWASMPQLTEPANLPPAPFVCSIYFVSMIVLILKIEPNWRCFCELDHSPNTLRHSASKPNPPQDLQCFRWLKPSNHSHYRRSASQQYGRYSPDPTQDSPEGHLLRKGGNQHPKRCACSVRPHQLPNQGAANRYSNYVSGSRTDYQQHHISPRIKDNKLVAVW
jgi:hypothetical protein